MKHKYGHHAIESAIEHGSLDKRREIVVMICAELQNNFLTSIENCSFAHVMEKALLYSGDVDKLSMVSICMTASEKQMTAIAKSESGCTVLGALLRWSKATKNTSVLEKLREFSVIDVLQGSKHGRAVLVDAGLRERAASR